jgi:oligopeptide transport system substrate-binding protein
MRGRARAILAIGATTVALFAAACGGGGGSSDNPGSQASGASGGEISLRGGTPQNPLIPANTNEVNGGNVLDAVNAKLIHYNADTAAPELDIAQSIDTSDNQTFTVKLNPYKFQDGTDVTAKSFVDAWNWAAYGPNGNLNAYFFTPFEGYNDVQCGTTKDGESDCKNQPPKAKTMSGLKVVDDTTFTIKTSEKVSNLPVRLGYTVFAPLPDSFFKDPKAYAQKPIGAGPFKVDTISDTEMVLSKFADYSGKNKPNVDKVTFRIYNDDGSAAYNDVVANNLDITDIIPTDRMTGDLYKTELPDRNGIRDTGTIAVNSFSSIDDNFK